MVLSEEKFALLILCPLSAEFASGILDRNFATGQPI